MSRFFGVAVVVAALAFSWGAGAQTSLDSAVTDVLSGDPAVVQTAFSFLGKQGVGALPALLPHLDDANPQTARTASVMLERLALAMGAGDTQGPAAEALAKGLDEASTPEAKREILFLLGAIGGEAQAGAVAAYLDNPELMTDACMALGRIPGDAVGDLLESALKDAPPERLFVVMQTLAERDDQGAIPALRAYLKTDNPAIQWSAMSALSELGVPPFQSFALTARSNAQEIRTYLTGLFASAFHALDHGNKKEAGNIFAYAASFGVAPHYLTAGILGMGEAGAETFLRQAIGALNTPEVRPILIRYLSENGDTATLEKLQQAYQVVDDGRKIAILAILNAGAPEAAANVLAEARKSESASVRYAALRLLGIAPGTDDLKAVVMNGLSEQRAEAADALLAAADAYAEKGDNEGARPLYEYIAQAPGTTAARIRGLDGLGKVGTVDSLAVVYEIRAASAAVAESVKRATSSVTAQSPTEIEISNFDEGEVSTSSVMARPHIDAAAEDVQLAGRAALSASFLWAVEKAYFTLIAKYDQPETVRQELREALEKDDDGEHRAFYETQLDALAGR